MNLTVSGVRIPRPPPYYRVMVKLVDTLDLGSSASTREGSSPSYPTSKKQSSIKSVRYAP